MLTVAEIAERLASDAESAARELLPAGRKVAGEWYASSSHSPLGYAVSVCLRGSKRGVVGFWAGNSRGKTGGSLIDLAAEIYGSKRAGVEWAKGFLGLSDDLPEQSEQARRRAEQAQRKADLARKERERRDARYVSRRKNSALDVWRAGIPIHGTAAEAYLLKRGLAPTDWPPSLRFSPELEWEPGRVWREDGSFTHGPFFPALVAAVQAASRDIVAVWSIFLTPDGDKAPVEPCKVGMGPAKGGAVRLGPAAHTIGVGEGLENSLAVRQLVDGAFPIWSTLSTSGMATLELPSEVKEVRIFKDTDLPSKNKITGKEGPPPGERAAEALAQRVVEMGKRAVIEESPSLPKEDFLNTLCGCNAPK